jgi:hypothetical protein
MHRVRAAKVLVHLSPLGEKLHPPQASQGKEPGRASLSCTDVLIFPGLGHEPALTKALGPFREIELKHLGLALLV